MEGDLGAFELTGVQSNKPDRLPKWVRSRPMYKTELRIPSKNTHEKLVELRGKSVVEVFEQFFTTDLMNLIREQSLRHASQKNNPNFDLSIHDLKIFIGILLLSGYHELPRQNMYWEQSPDVGVPLVYNAMTRERFRQIKQYLHFSSSVDKSDRMYKVRPYLSELNRNFLRFGVFDSHLTIGDMMVGYSPKTKGRRMQFGYKFWCLCSADGYLYNFSPYRGNEQGTLGVVQDLTSVIPAEESANHEIFFNDFFTSIDLLKALGDRNLKATGAIRESVDVASKDTTTERGHMECRFDRRNKVLVTRWNDNSPVTVATNYSTVFPVGTTTRYSQTLKKDVSVRIPKVIAEYNKSAGGVDVLEKQVSRYRTTIRGKKWWFPIFTQMLDVAVVNCWKVCKIANENLTLLDIRRRITLAYITKLSSNRTRPGPQGSKLNKGRVNEELRYDYGNHFVRIGQTQRRCAQCKKKTKKMCTRCDVPLHDTCFEVFHTK